MQNKTQEVGEDIKTLVKDVRALMAATADLEEEKVVEARSRLQANLEKRNELYGSIREKIVARANTVDKSVREHPYQAIGIALGIGALTGLVFMSGRKRKD